MKKQYHIPRNVKPNFHTLNNGAFCITVSAVDENGKPFEKLVVMFRDTERNVNPVWVHRDFKKKG